MPRLRSLGSCGLLLAAAFTAQERVPTVLGLVTDPSGRPLEAATVQLVPDAEPDLPALRDLTPLREPLTTASDTRGVFRLPSHRPGLLLATTKSGLGGAVSRAWPARAVRIRLTQMAELRLPDDGEMWLWPALLGERGDGERRRLPAMHGAALRLPEGHYEVWLRTAQGYSWQRLSLRSGERCTLSPPQDRATLPSEPDSRSSPLGFPDVLLGESGKDSVTLLGAARAATLIESKISLHTKHLRYGPSADRAQQPGQQLVVDVEDAPPGTSAYVLQGTAAGPFVPIASALVVGGKATLLVPAAGGNDWVVLVAKGRAAIAVTVAALRAKPSIALAPDRSLACTVRLPDGQPAAALAVTFEPEGAGPVTALSYTDELGRVVLGPVAGAGIVRIDDDGHLPVAVAIHEEDAAPIAVRLDAGAVLRGVVTTADGTPMEGVAVSVRAPSGTLRPAVRHSASATDGSFLFAGLDEATRLVVFATITRNGRTYSARKDSRGGDDLRLVLRDEDPELGPGGR